MRKRRLARLPVLRRWGPSSLCPVLGTSLEHVRFSLALTMGEYAMAKNEQTGKKAGTAASKVLKSGSTGKDSKSAAGSAMSQRPDKKK